MFDYVKKILFENQVKINNWKQRNFEKKGGKNEVHIPNPF